MTKKLLSIQYPPFFHPDFGKIYFGELGFDIYRCDIVEFSDLETNLEGIIKRNWNMSLEDFDAVLLMNVGIAETYDEKLLFPEKDVLRLKNRINVISKGAGKTILFLGMNANLPIEYYDQQSNLFDRLFISKSTPPSIWQEILDKLHLFAMDQ